MNKKNIIIISILAVFFLVVQACIIPGIELECVGVGDMVCDGTEAYECFSASGFSSASSPYSISRAPEYDAEYCGAVEEFDGESLARVLVSLSSDLEDVIDHLRDLKMQATRAAAAGDGRALVAIRAELSDVRTSLAEIRPVFEDVTRDIADADTAGEDTSSLDSLVTDVETELSVAEDLLLLVSTQVTDALAALSASVCSTDADCASGEACSSASACETDTDGDGDADSDDLDDDDDGYSDRMEAIAGSDILDASSVPSARDDDGDGMADEWERDYGLDYTDASDATADADSDGLTNLEEYLAGTDPTVVDTDGDGFDDYNEASYYFTDPNDSTSHPTDADADGLTAEQEATYGSSDSDTDSDDDGLLDGYEVFKGTDPTVEDTDGDTCTDYDELYVYSTDPTTSGDCAVETVTCYDTDSGNDESTKGTSYTAYSDGTVTFSVDESCRSATELTEYYCDSSNAVASTLVTCDNGCAWGACLDATGDYDGDGLSNYIEITAGFDPTADDLSAYQRFDFDDPVISSSTIKDDGKTGTLSGRIVNAYSSGEWYLDFTDTSNYITFPATEDSNSWGVSDWFAIKTRVMSGSSTTDSQPIVLHATSTCYKPQYMLSGHNGQYKVQANIAGTQVSATGGSQGTTWEEVVGVFNDNMLYLFIDGTLVKTQSTSGSITSSIKGLYIGSADVSLGCTTVNEYGGYIDTVTIWGD